MRDFTDPSGRTWRADVREDDGADYKGRVYLVLSHLDDERTTYPLPEIRWNGRRTARRTLETMSVVELRRRLREALGRAAGPDYSELPRAGMSSH